jgi:hypothetical protein
MHVTGNERQHLAALLVRTKGRRRGVESHALEMSEQRLHRGSPAAGAATDRIAGANARADVAPDEGNFL